MVAQNRCVGVSSKGVSKDKVCFYLLGVGCQQGQDIFEENEARKLSPTQNATLGRLKGDSLLHIFLKENKSVKKILELEVLGATSRPQHLGFDI